ncbi:hypothetical protein IV203_028057 [Nitzschia inconspicua]|uniref:Uncharacterized protein n=1 Tax=Nitzschia inconspicua TaxID=303405 RepID=A0A9K3M011_9STRA|nr:hypothetical protein IV203_028057 [Nitzschia inconspicua]
MEESQNGNSKRFPGQSVMPRKRPLSSPIALDDTVNFNHLPSKGAHDGDPGDHTAAVSNPPSHDIPSRLLLTQDELHRLIVSAIFDVGIQIASPSKITEQMHLLSRYPDLKTENVKSHLQRYRKAQTASKESFLEEYDRFLERLKVVHDHNTIPGAFGMIDLQQVLGGRAAALMIHSVMGESASQLDEPFITNNKHSSSTAQKKPKESDVITPPTANIHDYTFVHIQSPTSGINVTKFPVPTLTLQEMQTPVGKSFLQLFQLLKNMERFLLQKRGIQPIDVAVMPPPPPIASGATMVSMETAQRQKQLQPRHAIHASRKPGCRHATNDMPQQSNEQDLPRHASRAFKNRKLEKLRRLVSDMSTRRRRRAALQHKKSQVSFSVSRGRQPGDIDDESCSDSSSTSSSSYQRKYVPKRKTSTKGSTLVTITSPAQSSIDTSTSKVEKADWIFEGIPKPEELQSGQFLQLDSSSSSLSSDEMDQLRDDLNGHVETEIATVAAAVAEKKMNVYQRKRSFSDVSAIGRDDDSLVIDDDGNIRARGKVRLSRQTSGTYLAPVPENRIYDGMDASNPPPSPSPDEMMNYVFQDNADLAAEFDLEPNWAEFAGLSRSASPNVRPGEQQQQQPYSDTRHFEDPGPAQYTSHSIATNNLLTVLPTVAPVVQPLPKPPSFAESQPIPHAMPVLFSTQGPFVPYANTLQSILAVFQPPRSALQQSTISNVNEMPPPYNTTNPAQIFRMQQSNAFSIGGDMMNNNALNPNNNAIAPMLHPDQNLEMALQPRPFNPHGVQQQLQQEQAQAPSDNFSAQERRLSQLGRFYPVEAFPPDDDDAVGDSNHVNG